MARRNNEVGKWRKLFSYFELKSTVNLISECFKKISICRAELEKDLIIT